MKENFFLTKGTAEDTKISYRSWGPSDGHPIVCVHGLTGNAQDFKFVGEYFAQLNYHVIAIDMPGRGQSGFLADPRNYNFDYYIDVLNQFLDFLKIEKCVWLGVSMGGLLGIRMAGTEHSRISKMVLVDIGPEVPQPALDFISSYLTLAPVFETLDGVIGAMKQSIGTPFYRGPMTEEEWKYFAESSMKKLEGGRYTRSFDPGIAENFKTEPLGKTDLWDYWAEIIQPVLTVHGALSILLTPAIIEKMAARKQGANFDFATVENAGHVPSLYPKKQIDIINQWLQAQA